MKFVLLSGGSGKRLWPLSNDSRSKQFLKVLKREQEGVVTMESMVQRVWRQLHEAGVADDTYIATGAQQAEMIRSQLGDVPIIVEPSRRDTFPAIVLASVYLYSIVGVALGDTVAIMPVDPYAEDRFFRQVAGLDRVLDESGAKLALMGVKPTIPSEKYGYIVPRGESSVECYDLSQKWRFIDRFAEKPARTEAEMLIRQGALWNCGVFAFRLGDMIDLLVEKGVPLHYEELARQYDKLPKTSFDYEVVEKMSEIAVSEYDGFWKDLGTWNTLTEEMDTDVLGKGLLDADSGNSHIVNELSVPIVVMGLPDIVVSASPDGILVADKKASSKVKDMIGGWDSRPMYEERSWGSYRTIDHNTYDDGLQSMIRKVHLSAGKHLSYHYHAFRSETVTLLSGSAELVLEDGRRMLKPGDTVQIPPFAKHSIRAVAESELVEIQKGTDLSAGDVHRLAFSWQDIVAMCR